jgi:hypothetical protein
MGWLLLFFVYICSKYFNMTHSEPLSNLQLELLKLYATNLPEEDLLSIKRLLARYFMKKAIQRADAIWDERGYTNDLSA